METASAASAASAAGRAPYNYKLLGAIGIIIIIIVVVWYAFRAPQGQCVSNAVCGNQVCNLKTKMCVACDNATNFCSTPLSCTGGVCGLACTPGSSPDTCGIYVCDPGTSKCVPPCTSNAECGDKVCDTSSRLCVACDSTHACSSPQACDDGVCTDACNNSDQCGSYRCDPASQKCVPPCRGNKDCNG